MLRGNPADFYAVPAAGAGVTGVDDVGNVSLTQRVGDFVAAVADLAQNVGADAVFLQECGSSGGGLKPRR